MNEQAWVSCTYFLTLLWKEHLYIHRNVRVRTGCSAGGRAPGACAYSRSQVSMTLIRLSGAADDRTQQWSRKRMAGTLTHLPTWWPGILRPRKGGGGDQSETERDSDSQKDRTPVRSYDRKKMRERWIQKLRGNSFEKSCTKNREQIQFSTLWELDPCRVDGYGWTAGEAVMSCHETSLNSFLHIMGSI